ncbi:MAG: hypothetical protein IKZ58_05410 [Selenomonadaceae bacterium]|nr:hypothetical protein [Selenomonadaceae bacterium]
MGVSKKILFLIAVFLMFMFNTVCAEELDRGFGNKLNDSRVIVIVLEDYGGEIIHNGITTNILNAKLLNMGFKPVIDANHAIKLNDAQLLENVYNGYPEEFISSLDSVTDYLVIGRCSQSENDISFIDYRTGDTIDSPLKSVKVNLKVDVIIYDTGEIISTFTTRGIGFGNNFSRASDKAVEIAANEAANKLETAFKNLSSQTTSQFLFTITADYYEKLDQIIEDLRAVDSVNFVKIREQHEKTMVLSVEAYQPPSMIVQSLKEVTNLSFYVEKLSGNSCKLIFSDKEESNEDEKGYDDVNSGIDSSIQS